MIERLRPNEAIALGALRAGLADQVQVVTKQKLNGAPNAIARTGADIVYRKGAAGIGAARFRHQGHARGRRRRAAQHGGYWPALVAVLPDVADLARVTRRSTSAGLFRSDTGKQLPGSDGVHIYVAVQDGTDIERFLKTLHARCWLAGFGWMMVGAGGQLLERSIVDRMVGAPERLVFEGGPILDPPLRRTRKAAGRLRSRAMRSTPSRPARR